MSASPSASLLNPRIAAPFLLVALIWGSTWIVIRDPLGTVPPRWPVSYRFAIDGIAMIAWALTRLPGSTARCRSEVIRASK